MKIAIIGSGISGSSAAYYLNRDGHDVAVYESSHYFGGHTNTIDITVGDKTFPVDTGFLVHNNITYPNLIKFFEELGVERVESDMSLSVKSIRDDIQWASHSLNTMFTQRKNLFHRGIINSYSKYFDLIRTVKSISKSLIKIST